MINNKQVTVYIPKASMNFGSPGDFISEKYYPIRIRRKKADNFISDQIKKSFNLLMVSISHNLSLIQGYLHYGGYF